MWRQHVSLIALGAVFGLYVFWQAFRWSPYYPFGRQPKLDAYEQHLANITPNETPKDLTHV